MDKKKDVGQYFKERLGDLKDSPRPDLWNAIASEIEKGTRKRIAPLWYYSGGALMVILVISLLIFKPWSDNLDAPKTPLDNAPKITEVSTPNQTQSSVLDTSSYHSNSASHTNSNSNKTHTQKTATLEKNARLSQKTNKQSDNPTQSTINTPYKKNSNNSRLANNDARSLLTTKTVSRYAQQQANPMPTQDSPREIKARAAYKEKIERELQEAITAQIAENERKYQEQLKLEALAKAQKVQEQQKEQKEKIALANSKTKAPKKTDEERAIDRKAATEYKIAISPYTSLLNYGSLAKGSSLDDRLVDNPRESVNTVGYGVRMDYPLSEKASIRIGIGVAPLKYRTDNFQVSLIDGNINIFQLSAISQQGINQPGIETSLEAQNFFQQNNVVSIEQDISYLEVPVDYQYRLLNKRVGLSLNSGLSLFVLTENSVFATADSGSSILIGRETDLKDLSIAFNLGLGAYYNISKNWRFDAEPAFKYQLNPYIDGNTNFRPYYFGVQFGLSHKF